MKKWEKEEKQGLEKPKGIVQLDIMSASILNIFGFIKT